MKTVHKVRGKKSTSPKAGFIRKLFQNLSYSNPKFSRNIKLVALGALCLICYIGFNSLSNSVRNWQNSSIPNQIKVQSSNLEAFQIASEIANQELIKAHKQKSSRTTILKNISERLSNVKLIDHFDLRAGLDRSLQIKVTTQVPAYVVTDISGKSYLVGHFFRIMKDRIDEGSYAHLTRIMFNYSLSPKPVVSLRTGLTSASEFQDNFKRIFPKILIRSLAWDPHEGISAKIQTSSNSTSVNSEAASAPIPLSSGARIVLGFSPYSTKLTQLRNILEDASHKGIQLEAVDFNFSGKAILKISDAKAGIKNIQ